LPPIFQPMTKNSVHCHNQNKSMCWSVSPNMCAPEAFRHENNMFMCKRSKYRYKPSPRVELDGEQGPVVTPQGKYHKKISQLLEGYKRKDPYQKFQLAVPLTVPAFMHTLRPYRHQEAKSSWRYCTNCFLLPPQSWRVHIVRNRYHDPHSGFSATRYNTLG
jgi:hypothetical protein